MTDGLDKPRFIHNAGYKNFHQELVANLRSCDSFEMSVAFVRYSGLQLLLDVFKDLESQNIPGRILTSTYLNSTEPRALERLGEFANIATKIYVPSRDRGFHSKGYLFNRGAECRVIIGSSNITQSALKSNVEWNVINADVATAEFVAEVKCDFESQWGDERSRVLSQEFLDEYRKYIDRVGSRGRSENVFTFEDTAIVPNLMQREAVGKLDRLRKSDETKALAVAATGTGKTYMAVFDSLQVAPRRLLFLAHREDILQKAKKSFEAIIDTARISTGLFTGNAKDAGADYLFATVQTLQRNYREFSPQAFDYIVVDEAHHATSPSYQELLAWFQPAFLLGLTATPERSDSGDVYSVFGNNVAVEIRLRQALEWELVVPFHYFGITEFGEIDYEGVDIEDTAAVAKLLMVGRRVDYIVDKMNFYGHDGDKRKALAFCADVEHANFMAESFRERGIPALALTGADSVESRMAAVARLESDNDTLEILVTVDVFNEGIDIPSVNTVLMLRPTESAIVFVQQLGRGLRKSGDKEFVTVLDFIGNHRKSFLMAIALMGNRHFDRDDLRVAVSADFADIPGSTHIQMDRIAKERILAQLETERFTTFKYLRQEYFDFKRVVGGIPSMVDFLKVDAAPDPMKFVKAEGTLLQFVARVEPESGVAALASDPELVKFLRFFSDLVPLRRIHDAVIARATLERGSLSLAEARVELAKHVDVPRDEIVAHSFSFLCGEFLDSAEREKFQGLLFARDEKNLIAPRFELGQDGRALVIDVLTYAIMRYELEFGPADYGVPHLKLWETYTMRNVALVSNATRTHSSFRGMGLITWENQFFIFVDLHKEDDVREAINYKDSFLGPRNFQWESPNTTSPQSEQGRKLISHDHEGIDVHLFARKFREIEGISQPYTYFGKLHYFSHDPERSKPMRIYYALEHEVPDALFHEITTKV